MLISSLIISFSFLFTITGPQPSSAKDTWFTQKIVIDDEGVATVSAQLILPVPSSSTYAVLTDYPHWPDLFPRKPMIHGISKIDDLVRVTMHVPAGYLPLNLELVTDTVEPSPLRLNTTLVKGDFERYDWTWDLSQSPSEDSTVAQLLFMVAPSIWVPDWLCAIVNFNNVSTQGLSREANHQSTESV